MSSIESWLKEQRVARSADWLADQTLTKLKERTRLLDQYVPMKMKDGRDWLAYITEQIDPVASLVAPGASVPSTKKGQFSKIDSKLFKAGLQHEWTEDIMWRMKDAQEFARAKGITVQNIQVESGKVQVGQDNSLAETIFGTLASLVRGHINLLDFLAWQVLQTGAMTYSDPRTGLDINLDWKPAITASHNHFPALFTNPTRYWTAHDTADGLQDLVDMHYVYKYDNGCSADAIAMSEQLMHQLLRQKSTKEAVVSAMTVGYNIVGTPSVDQLNEVLTRRFLPPITLVDDHFDMDNNTGIGTPTRFLDPTRVVFLKKGIAERVLGGTLENNGKAGIYQRTFEKSKEPPLDISTTASQMLIVAPSISRLGMSRKVTTPIILAATQNLVDFSL